MEFKEMYLIDCVNDIIDYRGKTPKKLKDNWSEDGDYRAISAKNIKNMNLVNQNSMNNAKASLYKKWMKKEIDKGDILLTSEAPLGETLYWDFEEKIILSQRVFGLKANNEIVNSKYLFAYMQTPFFKHELFARESGTTVTGIRRKELEKVIIKVPSMYIQNYIGQIFYNINYKINNNNKIIGNLEELSQTLFKRWFVDFEFPDENGNPYKSSGGEMIDSELGNIPRDWEVNELGNYVDIIKGLSYKGAFLDKQHERSDSFPLLSISNFNFISGFKSNKTKYYFGDYKERHLVNPGDILIAATDLTQDRKILGAPAIVPNLNKTMIFSLDVFKITETTIPKYVLYFLLQSAKYREFVEGSATGTTVIRIAKNVILKVPIVIDKDISIYFDKLIKPYMEKIEHLSQENQKLTQLRDTLLPKLMSGEVEIPNDIEVNSDELSI
ncbi:restriction endonuclease subunit S [Staphylococcus aureus]|uniref:restriction endonuclease subunit S n=1 Tax=Staphylococcus aureus TaxID=1280 RepID=UPI0007679871|nr:restriction endonuclease subunit S [Staphylococcus aureus]KXA40335.1 type I restriction modification DNA specificity domain protein [Staphylococcus aureus]HDJ4718077.1 restriction endonuclease subunit S [Staphylococcus aureus]